MKILSMSWHRKVKKQKYEILNGIVDRMIKFNMFIRSCQRRVYLKWREIIFKKYGEKNYQELKKIIHSQFEEDKEEIHHQCS